VLLGVGVGQVGQGLPGRELDGGGLGHLAALDADDALHAVLVTRCGNGAVTATVERFTPLVRRLERLRFAAAHGADSVDLHDRLIAACERRDVEDAVSVTTAIWTALLAELSEETP